MNLEQMKKTDPEFAQCFENFALDEVVNEEGQQLSLPDALDSGLTQVAVKKAVYQAVDYLGYGRMPPFLNVTNELLEQRGIALPLEGQATTTPETRLEKGVEARTRWRALCCWTKRNKPFCNAKQQHRGTSAG